MSFISYVKLLESYRGRDKVMRTVAFGSLMASGMVKNNPELSENLAKFMKEISACRTILRLFDDASMLTYTLKYGLGKGERDIVQRMLQILSNVINQAFFPIEHIAWAAEKGFISMPAAPWWIMSVMTWASSLIVNIIGCIWRLVKLKKLEATTRSSDERKKCFNSGIKEVFNLVESVTNLGMAIHWMPFQGLWCGKLNNTTVGILGTTSSFIGLLKITNTI